jgi:hypothetical protein
MHPRGIYGLRNLGKKEMRSANGEYFVVSNCRKESSNNYKTTRTRIDREKT